MRETVQTTGPTQQVLPWIFTGVLIGILFTLLPPLYVAISFAVVIILAAMVLKPELAILAIVVLVSSIIFEESLPLIPIGIGSLQVSDLLLLSLLGYIFLRWVSGRGGIVKSALNIPLCSFYFIAVTSAMVSIMFSGNDFNYTIRMLRPLTYYLLFFVVLNLIRERRQLSFLITGLFVIGVSVGAVMIIQSILGDSVRLMPGRIEQAWSLDADFNVLRILPPGQTLIYVLFITAFAINASAPWRTLHLGLGILALLVLGAGVILTYNRTYWVATAIAFILLLGMLSQRARARAAALLVAMAVAAGGLVLLGGGKLAEETADAVLARVASLATGQELRDSGPIEDRKLENEYALEQIRRAPLVGMGLGGHYRPTIYGSDDELTYYVHNGYLWLLKDMGIVGAGAFVWFYGAFIIRWYRRWRSIHDEFLRQTVLGLGLATLCTLPMALFNPLFMQWFSIVVLATGMGIAESAYVVRRDLVENSEHVG